MKRRTVLIKYMQYRAEELKKIGEQRAELMEQMNAIVNKAEEEKRAMEDSEKTEFDELEEKVRALDETISRMKKAKKLGETEQDPECEPDGEERAKEDNEVRAFENYIRGVVEDRAETTLAAGDNGAVIPASIANKIIKKVVDISPIFAKATRYNVKGNLSIPYYDEETQSITVAFAEEFKALTSSSGKYSNIQLKGYLAGALTKISKSLINNSQFDIVGEVIKNMAEKIAEFIEGVLINGAAIGGAGDKIEGLTGVKKTLETAAANKITMDEVIELKDSVKDVYQRNACFIMHPETRTFLRKLKDSNGRYYMQDDVTSEFGTTLLSKPVYVSDNCPKMEAGKDAIFYGDLTGLAVKVSEESNIQVLREKYADEHVDGVIAWMEFDARVENQQKLAKLRMKTA